MLEKLKAKMEEQKVERWKIQYRDEFRYLRNQEIRNRTPRGVEGIYPSGIQLARVFNYEGNDNNLTKKGNAVLKMFNQINQ